MSQWRWVSDKKLEFSVDDLSIPVVITVNKGLHGWWSMFRIGGEEGYLRPIFGTPEEAAEAAVKEARKALSSAVRQVKRIPAKVPRRQKEVKP